MEIRRLSQISAFLPSNTACTVYFLSPNLTISESRSELSECNDLLWKARVAMSFKDRSDITRLSRVNAIDF